jgi:hypothetical protein
MRFTTAVKRMEESIKVTRATQKNKKTLHPSTPRSSTSLAAQRHTKLSKKRTNAPPSNHLYKEKKGIKSGGKIRKLATTTM